MTDKKTEEVQETWPAWMYHKTKGAKLVKEFDGEYPKGWYDCPAKAANGRASKTE